MDTNCNKVVYINKGEHDNPHELPIQQHSEGSTDIEHTLYLHTTNSTPIIDSFKKLEYIYQHFQDSEKTHELDQDIDRQTSDSTLYPFINNLANSTQQNTLYTMEEDASLFSSDTATPCEYNITQLVQNSNSILDCESKFKSSIGIRLQSKHKYRNVFGDSNIQYHDFNNGDALNFKDKYTALLQKELQNPYLCLHDPIMIKSYQISPETVTRFQSH